MYLVDRDPGRLRLGAGVMSVPRSVEGAATVTPPKPLLNVDATPEILTNGRMRVRLNLEYRPAHVGVGQDGTHSHQRSCQCNSGGWQAARSLADDRSGFGPRGKGGIESNYREVATLMASSASPAFVFAAGSSLLARRCASSTCSSAVASARADWSLLFSE